MLCYAIIWKGVYWSQVCRIEPKEYMYCKQHQLHWMWFWNVLFCMCAWKVLPFGVRLLEGWNGQTWKDHMQNCTSRHCPNVDGQIDPSFVIVLTTYNICFVGNIEGQPLCWFVINALKVRIWDVLRYHWKRYYLKTSFACGALCRPRYIFI